MSWTLRAVIAGWVLMPALAILSALSVADGRGESVWLFSAIAVVPLVLATVVARRAPRNRCAIWLAAASVGLMAAVIEPPSALVADVLSGMWMLIYLPLALLLIVVPTGRASSAGWRRVGWGLTATVAAFIAVCAVQALLPAMRAELTTVGVILLVLFLAGLVASAVAPVARYRTATAEERAQLRWTFLGGASLPLTLLLCWASYVLLGTADLVGVGLVVMYVAVPSGVAIALVRPNLFDVDRASIATVTAGALSGVVLLVLTAVGLVVGSALVAWSPFLAVGMTAALAAGAALVFRPVHRAFDRLLFPHRQRTIAALRSLDAEIEAGRADPADVQATLRESLRDPALEVAYVRSAGAPFTLLDGGIAHESPLSTPVVLHGAVIGMLTGSSERGIRPSSTVARVAAPLIDRARLHAELAAARAEVAASRARLVRTGIEEQRRLERDLHDGAQQRLVALGMRLRVLQRSAAVAPALSTELDAAVAELGTAVAELRRLAHGIRPSALDDGLSAALREIAARVPDRIALEVDAEGIPDDVAATAYFVVSETVTNALKHSGAEHIAVCVAPHADRLRIDVADDGRGGAEARGGLTALSDRVEALGGTLSVTSPEGAGTRIEVMLPCAS